MNTLQREQKVALLGDGGVGKTSFINKILLGGQISKKYLATLGVDVHPFDTYENNVKFKYNIWDLAGQEKFSGMREKYLNNVDQVIIFYSDNLSKKNAMNYWTDIVPTGVKINYIRLKSDLNSMEDGIGAIVSAKEDSQEHLKNVLKYILKYSNI